MSKNIRALPPSRQNPKSIKVNGIRNSTLEILRIICIVAIISDHFLGQSGIHIGTDFLSTTLFCFGNSLSRTCCAVFMIISAWFMVDAQLKSKKIFHIWLNTIFYTVTLTIFCYVKNIATSQDLYISFLPITESPVWFAGYYTIVILLSPLLNLFINKATKKVVFFTLFIYFCIGVLYVTATARLGIIGNELFGLLFIYILTGYIKRYLKIPKLKTSVIVFFSLFLTLCLARSISNAYLQNNLILNTYLEAYRAYFISLPALVLAFAMFFIFVQLRPRKNKFINKIASCSLGIYCFHQVPCWYPFLWTNIMFAQKHAEILTVGQRYLYAMISILVIFIVGAIIEIIRATVFDLLLEKREFYNKACHKLDELISNDLKSSNSINYPLYLTISGVITIFFVILKIISIQI